MRCAEVLLALLLYLSALSASAAEARKESLSDNAAFLSGRKWYRGLTITAAPHEDSRKDEVMEGKEARSNDANTVHSNGEEKNVEVSVDGLISGESGVINRKFVSLMELDAEDYYGASVHEPHHPPVRG